MYYKYGGSFIGTMTETNRYVKMYRTKKLPFVVNQSVWFEGEASLPLKMERNLRINPPGFFCGGGGG